MYLKTTKYKHVKSLRYSISQRGGGPDPTWGNKAVGWGCHGIVLLTLLPSERQLLAGCPALKAAPLSPAA